MKNIIITILIWILTLPSFSQKTEKAPFGGKLIDKSQNIVLIYERKDGSEITRMPNGQWYLTKESRIENPTSIPSWVHKRKPMKIIYTASNGKEYITNDGLNWMKNENTEPSPSVVSFKDVHTMQLKSFVAFEKLNLRVKTNQGNIFHIIICDLQGNVVSDGRKELSSGFNNLSINTKDFAPGTYFYIITDGITRFSGLFIKY